MYAFGAGILMSVCLGLTQTQKVIPKIALKIDSTNPHGGYDGSFLCF